MTVRKKGRNRFNYKSDEFSWWIENDKWLHVCDTNKEFVIKCPMAILDDELLIITVNGPKFPGLNTNSRPVNVVKEKPFTVGVPMGKTIEELIEWAFSDEAKHPTDKEPRFA